jgi:hypothetical protein
VRSFKGKEILTSLNSWLSEDIKEERKFPLVPAEDVGTRKRGESIMQQVFSSKGIAVLLIAALMLAVGPLLDRVYAVPPYDSRFTINKDVQMQMFCDEGFGPQFSGCVRLNGLGDFRTDLTGLPPNTPFSCFLWCGLTGESVELLECGITDDVGNLQVNVPGISEAFGGTCFDLSIEVGEPIGGGDTYCTGGFAAGACQRRSVKRNGVLKVRCTKAGCTGNCHVRKINKDTGSEEDTGVSEFECPEGYVCTCPCT